MVAWGVAIGVFVAWKQGVFTGGAREKLPDQSFSKDDMAAWNAKLAKTAAFQSAAARIDDKPPSSADRS
jgi:hypothetical protein